MNGPDRELARINDARRAELVDKEFGAELDDRREAVINAVTARLAKGETLDPQFAVQKWIELHAIQSLKRSLRQKIRSGKGASERLEGDLTSGLQRS